MKKSEYLHAIKALQEKKEELTQEIKFIDDEINLVKKEYINLNTKFNIGDIVEHSDYKKEYKKFKIIGKEINNKGRIVYHLQPCAFISGLFTYIDESKLKLIKKDK